MADEQQSNITPENNYAVGGMNLDNTINQIPKGKLTYALNAAVENFDSNSVNYQNEPGNELCLNFPAGYVLIGKHFIPEQDKHIFFLVNPDTGDSEIGYMEHNDCFYYTFINGKCLNFNINYPIHKSVHKITNCTTEVYWTDGYNSRRYIDLNNPPFKTTIGDNICDVNTFPEIDCNKINIQPNFSIPELSVSEILNGGELIAGTYQFSIQYSDALGNPYTSYYSVTNPTPIFNTHVTTPDFNYPVSKSIAVNISDLDVTGYFKYYNLAVIKTINSITSVELVGTYYIDGKTKQIIYTGQNKTSINLTIDDIFQKYPYYDIAQDVTTVQDVIVWDNLSSIDRISYQSIANQISLQWQTYRIPATESYANELNATNLRGYLRDEVYAFEIVFLLRNGKQTDGFHIPGRALVPSDKNTVNIPETNADFIGAPTGVSNGVGYSPYWKIYNTAFELGDATGEKIGNATPYKYGEFAYWESSEKYPCNEIWGALGDTPIRHHKFPDVSVSPIFENGNITYNPDGTFANLAMGNKAVYPIGVRVDMLQIRSLIEQSNLSAEQKSQIVGFKIVRGDRNTNKSIVAKGILRNVGFYDREGTTYMFPNYPYNDLRQDPFLLNKSNAYAANCRKYTIYNVTVAGSYTIVNCIDGKTIVNPTVVGQTYTVCSSIVPIITGTAKIQYLTAVTYKITTVVPTNNTLASTRFETYGDDGGFNSYYYLPINDSLTVISYLPPRFELIPKDWSYTLEIVSITPLADCLASNLDAFTSYSERSNYRHVFNSPETSFGAPTLGDVLKIESSIFGLGSAHFVEVKKHALYKLLTKEAQQDALTSSNAIGNITNPFNATAMFTAYQAYLQIYINGITRKNYTYSYNSIADYNYWTSPVENRPFTQRTLENAQYLFSGFQSVGETYNINNYERESSVYLKTIETRNGNPVWPLSTPDDVGILIHAQYKDKSRYTLSDKGLCTTPNQVFDINVVSYYGSIKNTFSNQWGQMYSYNTIDTGFQANVDDSRNIVTVFGGDTFIGRFGFKTKLPFFIDNRVGAPDDSDIFYDEIGNVAYPKYWFSSNSILSDYPLNISAYNNLTNIISYKSHNFDCPNTQYPASNPYVNPTIVNPNRTFYDGKMYLFAYGIPYFYCESSINVDLRQAFNNREGDFYPHVASGIPDNWFQETVVPIALDNTYYYNISFSKQNKENYFSHLPENWSNEYCYTHYPFRGIWSEEQDANPDNRVNAWLIYKPISFFDFPQNFGKLTSLDGIQNKAILARFENKSLLYNTLLTVDTSNPKAAYLGNSSLFRSSPPIDFAETDLGYVGSQHKFLLKIPQGQITIDAKRGQIFLISGNSVSDITAFGSGVNRFITDHMSFEILRYFPDIDVDNHYKGLGLHGVYDSKFDRVIITKLDYIPNSSDIKYDYKAQKFYINEFPTSPEVKTYIELTDAEYFCNKSWTLSFNVNTNSWISFHSYIPNWYIAENNFFYSGLNDSCDLEVIAFEEVPYTTTTSTTTTQYPRDCNLTGTASYIDCSLEGKAGGCATYSYNNTTADTVIITFIQCNGAGIEYYVFAGDPPGTFCAIVGTITTGEEITTLIGPCPLDFDISYTCDISVNISGINARGGSGTGYKFGNIPFTSYAAADANTTWITANDIAYGVGGNGTYYVVLMDSIGEKIIKSITTACP